MIKPPLQRKTVRGGFARLVDVQPGICCAEACDPINASRRTPAAINLVVIIGSTLVGNFRGRNGASLTHVLRNAAVPRDDFQILDVLWSGGLAQRKPDEASKRQQWGSNGAAIGSLQELPRLAFANWRSEGKITRSH
jgi:hypothetical protein